MLFPRKDEVLEIHGKLLKQFGGLPGIRDEGLLECQNELRQAA
jgi:prophage maintenance system killer protein